MNKADVAAMLDEMGQLLDLLGENPFRVRSYQAAARAVERYPGEFSPLTDCGEIEGIPGVGSALAQKIIEFLRSGSLGELQELRSRVPEGLREMLRVPGLGTKKIHALHQGLGVTSLAELEAACRENRLVELPGFGARTQQNILEGIAKLRRYLGRLRLPEAVAAAEAIRRLFEELPGVRRVSVAGELRRWWEAVDAIELVAAADRPDAIAANLSALAGLAELNAIDGATLAGRLIASPGAAWGDSSLPVRIHIRDEDSFVPSLIHLTGSEQHVGELETRARALGLRLDEKGLFRGKSRIACGEEEDLYRALEMPAVPVELREGQGEVEAAIRGELPRLVAPSDLRGMIHVHTDYSDGTTSIADMARAAAERGYRYLGIADHSRSAAYAGGLEIDRVRAQRAEIDRLNRAGSPIPILAGIESDILGDGSLDYPEDVLEAFDFVIASVHSRFRMGVREMTTRIVCAVKSPYVHILGHPTGRLLLERDPYEVDLAEVLRACGREGVAVELNAHPARLDLDWREIPRARREGAMVAINPDAHRPEEMDYVMYGVAIARKGWLAADEVLNTRDLAGARAFFQARREKHGRGRE